MSQTNHTSWSLPHIILLSLSNVTDKPNLHAICRESFTQYNNCSFSPSSTSYFQLTFLDIDLSWLIRIVTIGGGVRVPYLNFAWSFFNFFLVSRFCSICSSIDWLIESLTDWLIDWVSVYLFVCLFVCLSDWTRSRSDTSKQCHRQTKPAQGGQSV